MASFHFSFEQLKMAITYLKRQANKKGGQPGRISERGIFFFEAGTPSQVGNPRCLLGASRWLPSPELADGLAGGGAGAVWRGCCRGENLLFATERCSHAAALCSRFTGVKAGGGVCHLPTKCGPDGEAVVLGSRCLGSNFGFACVTLVNLFNFTEPWFPVCETRW